MMRCSRPMSWALASTWPSGGRRSTSARPSAAVHAVGEVGVAAGDDVEAERRRRAVDVLGEPGRDVRGVDAGHVVLGDHRARRYRRLHRALAVRGAGPPTPTSPGRPSVALDPWPYVDVTDADFETEVVERSKTVPVVVDLWAPWCGPCRTLGPIIEKVVDATDGKVVLVKVNVDENPAISQAFQVQSIPAVYALRDGQVVDGFVGAYPEHEVQRFVDGPAADRGGERGRTLLAAGDEASLRQALELRARQRGRHRRPRRAARRAGRRRGGAGAAGADPRVRAHAQGRCRGPRRQRARRRLRRHARPACSPG